MRPPVALEERLAAIARAQALAPGRLAPAEASALDDVRQRAGERLSRGDRVVVAALGGGTGSGKSSLFNALAGRGIATVGARRPVTSEPTALAVGDPDDAVALLDWLDVRDRQHVAADGRLPDGLVLVDLPDHDSVEVSHRRVVDRYVERVDVLVWVVDPRKYAQRALHATYLRELTAHADVTLVVLNRIDELAAADRATVLADLHGLLAAEGLDRVRVLATSATTGEGIDELLGELRGEVERRRAVATRIAADVVTVAGRLHEDLGPAPAPVPADAPELVAAMATALGLDGIGLDAERAYREDARVATRPAVSGAVVGAAARVIRPLRRWRTERARRRSVALRAPVGELPVGVRHALLGMAEAVTADASRWRPHLRSVADAAGADLARTLSGELERIELTPRPRRWWAPVALLWTLVELVALAGAGWLLAAGVVAWLQLPALPSPEIAGWLPLPTALLLGGLGGWLLVAAVRRRAVVRGARRQRRRTAEAVADILRDRAATTVLTPLQREVDAIRDLTEALRTAAH